ncbi:MAG: hypothetical protein BA864_12540 [Desulfuromonadales bacterium C00003093]|nr:MAG: hypothetical protein BA864_12540 [Desulfuromonadales bacterium C00003093]
MKMNKAVYERIAELRKVLKLNTDAETVRFCVTYTSTSIAQLDEKHITGALGVAIAEAMFDTNGNEDPEDAEQDP